MNSFLELASEQSFQPLLGLSDLPIVNYFMCASVKGSLSFRNCKQMPAMGLCFLCSMVMLKNFVVRIKVRY